YKKDGKFTLAYLKKDLMTAGSEWTEEEGIEMPDFTDIDITHETSVISASDELLDITICQNSNEWDFVYFVFSFKRSNGTKRHIHIRYLAQDDFFDKVIGSMLIFDNKSLPVTAIKHQIPNDTNPTELIGVSVIFKNEMQTSAYGALSGLNPIFPTKQSIANPRSEEHTSELQS